VLSAQSLGWILLNSLTGAADMRDPCKPRCYMRRNGCLCTEKDEFLFLTGCCVYICQVYRLYLPEEHVLVEDHDPFEEAFEEA
jgi:hypothetical protein